MSNQMQHQKAPYRPNIWSLGGMPTETVDVPITAVFLVLFMIGAAAHMTIFQLNRKRDHKFLFSAAIFGFCISRVITCALRIASICLPHNINLLIAASIFLAVGVIILFVVNSIWALRILRSLHPTIGWHSAIELLTKALYVLVACTLALVITSAIQTYFTLNPHIRSIDRSLQLYGQTYFGVMSSLPVMILILTFAIPCRASPDHFGHGTLRTKVIVLLVGSLLTSLGAWYRCGTSWEHPVPRSQPLPAYFDKVWFYIFNFGVEILTVFLYAVTRMDLRFHVPNGAKGPGSYAANKVDGKEVSEETVE